MQSNLENGGTKHSIHPYWRSILTGSFRPTVYAQVRASLLAEVNERSSKSEVSAEEAVAKVRLEIASEMVDHIFAGSVAYLSKLLSHWLISLY